MVKSATDLEKDIRDSRSVDGSDDLVRRAAFRKTRVWRTPIALRTVEIFGLLALVRLRQLSVLPFSASCEVLSGKSRES